MTSSYVLKNYFQRKMPFLFRHYLITLLISFTVLIYVALVAFTFNGKTEIVLLLSSEKSTIGQFILKKGNNNLDDSRTVHFKIKNERFQTVRCVLPNEISNYSSISFIPGAEPHNKMIIHYLLIKKSGFIPIHIDLKKLDALNGISSQCLTNVLRYETTNDFPEFSFEKGKWIFKPDIVIILVYLLIAFVISIIIVFSLKFLKSASYNLRTLVLVSFFSVITALGLILALKAGFNASPDERDHFLAAEFFKTHTLTPERNTESAIYTYSDLWDYSRVYHKGLEYILAGKFSNIFDMHTDSYKSVRFFGILLLAFFVFLSLRFQKQNLIFLPIIMLPQVWYHFSYLNESNFPLFISFLLLVLTEAFKEKLLQKGFDFKKILSIFLIGFSLGMLIISKKNYYVFLLFFIFYLLTLPVVFHDNLKKTLFDYLQSFKKFVKVPLLIFGIALMFVCARELTFENQKDKTISNETAQFYNQIKQNKANHLNSGVSGAARFGSYTKMMFPQWTMNSYKSFISCYGYMIYWGNNLYYRINYALHVLLLCGFLFFLVKNFKTEYIIGALVCLVFILVIIYASSYIYSYKYDYQPQGRYLFPVLPIIGLFIYKINFGKGEKFIDYFVMPISIILFLLGIYSFVFNGYVSL